MRVDGDCVAIIVDIQVVSMQIVALQVDSYVSFV